MKRLAVLVLLAACGGGDDTEPCDPLGPMCESLSSYGLFEDIPAQTPAEGVMPYQLNTALFSDYATKYRFLAIPDGETATWQDPGPIDLPVGTIVVKTFAYPPVLVETRLLIHKADGWEGSSYLYDEGQDDARLAVAGATVHIDETDADYAVPNKNQCKNCHEDKVDVFEPLGPKVRHINRDGQLEALIDAGKLSGAPDDPTTWPKAPVFDDPDTGTVEERARAWLDVNCSHCHNPEGAARTSGLDLRFSDTDPVGYGVCKTPIAAGIGSGGRPYDIVPGDPEQSILVFRIESTNPEIKMPELGRNLVHEEGVALIREWITAMTGNCNGNP